MRTLLWLTFLCLLLVTLFLRVWLYYAEEIILDLLRASGREGLVLPFYTHVSLSYRKFLPILTLPWFVCASFLTVGNRPTALRVAYFAATAMLAAICMTSFVIISSLLPFPDLFYIEAGFKSLDW